MKINITARHFKAKESTQTLIKERINALEKYNENIIHANVVLSYDKPPSDTKYCEVIITLKEKVLTAKESAGDFEKAIDFALAKIETRLYKVKDKQKSKIHSKTK